ncbi:SH3 domain-containing protein [Psychrobium sp. 1_MG-2023]|uniref:SH3 domain-containing protein n=1 Tax=Psychrobium sp. 1_MG-2023 TaxID=3062624 RepID=UPI00351DFF2C
MTCAQQVNDVEFSGELQHEPYYQVEVIAPFIELRSGPASGYPIFHVAEQGEKLSVVTQRTSWYKVITIEGVSGWVSVLALQQAQEGNTKELVSEYGLAASTPFEQRTMEFGIHGGVLEGVSALGAQVSWQFTPTLAASLHYDQALGDVSENRIASVSLSHQPFKEWAYSPYFAIGAGVIDTKPRSPLIGSGDESRRSDAFTFSVGVKKHVMRNFIISIEYKNISALTKRDETEELEQWTTGFSVYF